MTDLARREGDWMLTHRGEQFWPLDPRVDELDISDIAHSLSLQCRYNGHTRRFYSVAEHSVLVSHSVAPEDALWGLLHDAAEAYIGDMVRPVKRHMHAFQVVEERLLYCIAQRFDLMSPAIPESVHEADNRILLDERAALLNLNGHRWHESIEQLQPLGCTIRGLDPIRAEHEFLAEFERLGGVA